MPDGRLQRFADENVRLHFLGLMNNTWLIWLGIITICLMTLFVWLMFGKIYLNIEARGIVIDDADIDKSEEMIIDKMKQYKHDVYLSRMILDRTTHLYQRQLVTIRDVEMALRNYQNILQSTIVSDYDDFYPQAGLTPPLMGSRKLTAMVFINQEDSNKIKRGMVGELFPVGSSRFDRPSTAATVRYITRHAISMQMLNEYLHNIDLARATVQTGAPYVAFLILDNADTIEAGTMVVASIHVFAQSPLQYMGLQRT